MLPQPQPVTLPLPSVHQVSISRETFAALAGMRDGWSEGWESRADDVESRAAFATGRGLASSPARRANAPSPGAEE